MSSSDVPWPGSRGISVANPAAANASASGRIDCGHPVNPCSTSAPCGPPSYDAGSAPSITITSGTGRSLERPQQRANAGADCTPKPATVALSVALHTSIAVTTPPGPGTGTVSVRSTIVAKRLTKVPPAWAHGLEVPFTPNVTQGMSTITPPGSVKR